MKSSKLLNLLLLALITLFLSSCVKDSCKTSQTYLRYDPVYKTSDEIRTDLLVMAPRALEVPGKIYYYDHYLLIGEKDKGIHVIDNINPESPVNLAFWAFEGNNDIAISDGKMFLDQYIDMVTFDITHFLQPTLVCRRNDVFPGFGFVQGKGYLVEYLYTEVQEESDCYSVNTGNYYFEDDAVWVKRDFAQSLGGATSFNPAVVNGNQGIAGSFTRFCLKSDHLYAVTNNALQPFTIAGSDCPVPQQSVAVGWNIETIFPYKDNLFIGSQNGVFIYDASDAARPAFRSSFSHATGCDPVVCDDGMAFVTIHNGTTCGGIVNELDILDIANPTSPIVVQSYPMAYPLGLSLTEKHLYLCDDGFKIYDRTNPRNLKLLSHLNQIKVNDVIALGNELALIIGDDGFYQYNTLDPAHPVLLSKIAVQ
ncbi:MAG: hypothetical protein IPN29_05030 [Saprospiraceae bacterium]|nr:hypothetical protein [Saprospiraceae bacterium]